MAVVSPEEQPNEEQSAYDFWQDAAASIETNGNAYIWKAIGRRPVQDENDLAHPGGPVIGHGQATMQDGSTTRFAATGPIERVPANQILHIRG